MPYNLRPSASGIWTKCAANPRISENAKTVPYDSDPAREGTCAAWVAECVLRGDFEKCADMLNHVHENGWTVDADMVFHVQGYVDKIRSRGASVIAESYVRLTDHIAGTLDSSSVSSDGSTLYVDDLKYGYKIVEVYELPQIIIYGYAEYLRLNNPNITHVVLGIYQPRAMHPEGIHRTWKITVQELYEKASAIAKSGDACQNPNAIASPGSHCEHCKGRLECAALTFETYQRIESIREGRQTPATAEQVAAELDFLDMAESLLSARKTAIRAEAEYRLSNGEFLRGWGIKDRYGHRKFKFPPELIEAFTGSQSQKLVEKTPAEMEKDGVSKDIMRHLAYTPRIGKKLEKFTERDIGRMFRDRG